MNIEELKKFLTEEISYFQNIKSKNQLTEEGKIRLETFEYVLEHINSN